MKYFLFKSLLYFILLFTNLYILFILTPTFINDAYNHDMFTYSWQIAVYMFVYYFYRLMTRAMVTINELIVVLKSNIIALVAIFFIISMTKIGEDTSRKIILLYFLLNMFIPLWTYLIKKKVLALPYFRNKIFVICDTKGLKNVESWFSKGNSFGYDIDIVFNVDNESIEVIEKKVDELIKYSNYEAAVIDIEQSKNYNLNKLVDYIQRNTPKVIIMPQIANFPMLNGELLSSNYHKGMAFFIKNNLLSPVDKWLKSIFDIVVGMTLIILFSPILLLLYSVVFISTKGHPLFKHKRIGHHGEEFMVYKFRSMHLNAEEKLEELLNSCPVSRHEWEENFKLKDDPRITRVGNFIRKTSLDELPQLINVLKGEMSLVGPRPIIRNEVAKYGEYFEYFSAVKPGITGLWQVSGRNDIDYDERVQLDVWYTRNWSIELDIQILFQTISIVLLRKGSY